MKEFKKCIGICGLEKSIEEFSFRKDTGKFRNICKSCITIQRQGYYIINKNKILQNNKEYGKIYYIKNKEIIAKKHKQYYQENQIILNKKHKLYNKEHKKQLVISQYQWYEKNKKEILEKQNLYNKNHKKERIISRKIYNDNNKTARSKYEKNRRNNDIIYKINKNFSNATYRSLKGNKNNISCWSVVRYTLEQYKQNLENQFYKDLNITWNNYGSYWHVDHIIPISSFDIKEIGDEEFHKCWALENLQPLEAKINKIKSNKLNWKKE